METLKHPIPEGSTITNPVSKSWVASRFLIIDDGGGQKRRCSYVDCGKEYSRGTSHMILKRHWSRQHNDHFSETNSLRLNNRNSSPSDQRRGNDNNKTLTKSPHSIGGSPNKSSKKSKIMGDIYNNSVILINNKPISSLDKAQLDVKLVAKRLKEATSIHLTLDIHNPKKGGKTYGIITAHSMSDTLEIKSVLLEYKHLPYPDDSNTIYEFLRSCFTKFNIREKIVSIASSSSETISMAIQEVDKRFRISKNFNFSSVHIKCFPQFVHLNVIDVLKSQETMIDNVRKVVTFTNNNTITVKPLQQNETMAESSMTEDNSTTTNNKATGIKLPQDQKNTWNTTYNMIDTFFQQRSIVEPTLIYMQNTESTDVSIDWDRLYTLIQLLKPFYEVITKFSTDNYTPVSLVAVCIPHLMDHLSNNSWVYEDLMMAAHNFKMQLESYRQEFQSELTVIAGLLDPRVKDTFVSTEGRDDAIAILRKRMENFSKTDSQHHHQYSEDSLWARIFTSRDYDEIIDYLESPREHGYANNNAYWEAHKHVYPSLYILAKTLACVQATSVPGERMFSAAENIDKERKIHLESTNSKELMKSWAKYLEK